MHDDLILLTGATGYVGGRLLSELQRRGRPVRCLVRRPEALTGRVLPSTEVVQGDLLDEESLKPALEGVHTAYYLVHSMGTGPDYADLDRRAALAFGRAARAAGVRRIIYLGGLANPAAELSRHLRSRLDTGDRLRESGVPVIEFRASIIIGAGSLSFEMIRALVDRLPVMVCPQWVRTLAQPIGIDDLIAYLCAALDLPEGGLTPNPGGAGGLTPSPGGAWGLTPNPGGVFEIGGAETASYGDLMAEYARQRGLRRLMVPVPLLTPWLSSLWLGLVTPVYARVGRELIGGVRNRSVVRTPAARRTFAIRPIGFREAMARAMAGGGAAAETSWSDARSSTRTLRTWTDAQFGTRLVDVREIHVDVPPAAAFAPIRRIGGIRGWYFADTLWGLRGWLDLLVGGAGLRRGRRDPETPRVGDALDFWRVEAYQADGRLRLSAEMRVPGRAWLEFEIVPEGTGSRIRQTATFDPVGRAGTFYWYALYPIHSLMFRGMLRRIARIASDGYAAHPDARLATVSGNAR